MEWRCIGLHGGAENDRGRKRRDAGHRTQDTRQIDVVRLTDRPDLRDTAAEWFHEKWGVPLTAYQESMATCLQGGSAVPQWYLVLEGGRIVAGAGVIENDFHDRKDLAPNVCAVYTEKDLRGRGIAGRLLEAVCADMSHCGIDTLFLLTDHTSFYERYGWEFFCMAQGEGETEPSRMYVHYQNTAADE